ncbi:CTB family bacteriocin [Nostoc sp. CHAB 5844]|nr:CTB family bacteriocin [Nostoc sp. CHAB 5844]
MSHQILSDLWIELVHQQQELLTGGVDFQTNDINFYQSFEQQKMTKTKQGQTNISNTYTQMTDCKSNAQSSLSINPLNDSDLAAPVNSSVVLP